MVKRYLLVLLFLIFTIFGEYSEVYAQEQFETSYNIDYAVNRSGETQVTQDITITNKQSDVIATNYTLTIRQIEIYDLEAFNKKEKLKTEITNEDSVTNIKVIFEKEVIGEGRKNNFKIRFKSKDIAGKLGEIWNVNFPKAQISDSISEYNVSLSIPMEFGPEVYISPSPIETQKTSNTSMYKFNKDSLQNKGITASFGKYQIMNFQLKYQLYNDSNFSSDQEIALPPDILGRQQVSFKQINPKPTTLSVDQDGNYLAKFNLGPKEKTSIEVIGTVRLSGKQIKPEFGGGFNQLPSALVKNYTKENKYWETRSPKVQEIANAIYKRDATVSENALEAYNYVTKNLKYDFDLVKKDFIERKGSETALTTNGKWACMEFTDSFIAIARAMGIPARELDGYAATANNSNTPLSIALKGGDLLHSWAEYYDSAFGWVPVDPTWGNTSGIDYFNKLDTSHFVFAIKGKSSELPLPAGSYRFDDTNEKLISADFAQNPNLALFNEQLYLYNDVTWNPLKILMGQKKYILSNEGNVAVKIINDSIDTLLPGNYMAIYLPKDLKAISYMDFNGNEIKSDLEIKEGKPTNYKQNYYSFILVALALMAVIIAVIYFELLKTSKTKKRLKIF